MKKVLLTFDLEEFDLPLEYKNKISKKKQIEITSNGLKNLLKILTKYNINCTFFTTYKFASECPGIIKLLKKNHEIALHIIKDVGVPILGPSANFHGEPTQYEL